MKVKVPLLLLLVLAAAAGYMLGTESGRAQRDVILVKLGKGPKEEAAGDDEPAAEAAATADAGDEAAADEAASD